MYENYSDIPDEELREAWTKVNEHPPDDKGWEGDNEPLLRALVD